MKVSPAEIEEVIYTHPAVKTVCVVGIDDDSAGEVPLACVIVKEGHSVTEQEIVKLVEGTQCKMFIFGQKLKHFWENLIFM